MSRRGHGRGRAEHRCSEQPLVDRYRPDLLQFSSLQRHNHRRNFELAFAAAEKIEIAVSPKTSLSDSSRFSILKIFVTSALMKGL